jgi:hypothetical protein
MLLSEESLAASNTISVDKDHERCLSFNPAQSGWDKRQATLIILVHAGRLRDDVSANLTLVLLIGWLGHSAFDLKHSETVLPKISGVVEASVLVMAWRLSFQLFLKCSTHPLGSQNTFPLVFCDTKGWLEQFEESWDVVRGEEPCASRVILTI